MTEAARIEKLMSLTLTEFQATLAPLVGAPLPIDQLQAEIPVGEGRVVVAYDRRPSVRLGGLLDMPRAVVSLTFENISEVDQAAFLKRFDLTFQRGGG